MLLTLKMAGFGDATELQEYRCHLVKAISPYQCRGKVQHFCWKALMMEGAHNSNI